MSEKLINFLDIACNNYYEGNPIITDAQFDALADSVGYTRVGGNTKGKTAKHLYQLYSLQKHYEGESTKPLAEYKDNVCSVKLDGAAVSHLYVDGVYMRTLTRGNGVEGLDITDKFLATDLIPKRIALKGIIQIDGEIAAPSSTENARNYAAGALNLKSAEDFKTRSVEFFAYNIRPSLTAWYDVDMRTVKKNGFNTCLDKDLDKIFPSDGLVFRVNSNAVFDELGFTSKHPRGAYALKERKAYVETTLLDVEWNVGKTGKVTPTAILEPVYIGDALVSRATLNNPGFIEALGLRKGDRVAVERAGEIIPCILHKVDA